MKKDYSVLAKKFLECDCGADEFLSQPETLTMAPEVIVEEPATVSLPLPVEEPVIDLTPSYNIEDQLIPESGPDSLPFNEKKIEEDGPQTSASIGPVPEHAQEYEGDKSGYHKKESKSNTNNKRRV